MINMDKVNECKSNCVSCVIKPCQVGCPLNNDITEFIRCMKKDDYKGAYNVLLNTTVLSSLCGRICPHQSQCQGMCVKGISYNPVQIGYLESVVGDMAIDNEWNIPSIDNKLNKKVLVIGGGPSSLTCAAFLARNGVDVTIYEKYDYLGGLLVHGIPEFRLDKDIVKKTIDKILKLGINVKYNMELGKDFNISDIIDEYDAIYIGIGANISSKMNIPGEELDGVYGGNELLEFNNHPDYTNKVVAVSGGGNVAMDVARTIKRMGAKDVYVIYRRSEKEMPAEKIEVEEAKEEGINFLYQTNILNIVGNNKVEKIECIKTELVQKEGENRLSPVNIEGSNYYLDIDYIVMAIGSYADTDIMNSIDLELNQKGKIKIDSKGNTSNPKIFSGGDVAGTKGTVAFASRAGRNAAYSILEYLK